MIKRFINKLLGKEQVQPHFGKRVEVPQSVHQIDVSLVDERALNVVQTLKKAGYEAYIVGGAVRDLLVGMRPKDFDVATNATPEQVKSLFRRAFIIGRRFRIVHVVFGRGREHEVIEVSTFRAYLHASDAAHVNGNEKTSRRALEGVQHAVDASGRVLRDNVWGPQDEDAARRDFTINAMYYDPERQIVVDYHKGMADVKNRTIRMIGDAMARYREDPVRIIRAIRFAAKLSPLDFRLDKATSAPIREALPLLHDVPQSRMFDEMLKLLQTGHALGTIGILRKHQLTDNIYPLLTLSVQRADDPFVNAALQDTDRRVGEGKPVAPSFLLSCLLWQDVREAWARKTAERKPPFVGLQEAIDEVFDACIGDVSGRGKLAADMREIWMMQPRFEKRSGNSPYSLVAQLRFRAGFDFLRLRSHVGEVEESLADWWQTFSGTTNDALREDLIATAREQQRQRQREVQQQGRAGGKVHLVSSKPAAEVVGESVLPDADAPKKRRRRRRKPAAAADGAAPVAHEAADSLPAQDDTAAVRKPRRRRKPAGDAGSDSGADA